MRIRRQHREAVIQPLGDLLDGQHAAADGRELDRQRETCQAVAEGHHGRGVPRGKREPGARLARPHGEEPDGIVAL